MSFWRLENGRKLIRHELFIDAADVEPARLTLPQPCPAFISAGQTLFPCARRPDLYRPAAFGVLCWNRIMAAESLR